MAYPERRPVTRKNAVFLDRDGVLNHSLVENGKPFAPRRIEDFHVIDDAPGACAQLAEAGFALVVVTNQPNIANGLVARSVVDAMHEHLNRLLPLTAVMLCPHGQTEGCDCRKPKPGMLLQAAGRFAIDLKGSFMVGDRNGDMAAGRAAGCRTIFIDHGYASEAVPSCADWVVASLAEAVPVILGAAI